MSFSKPGSELTPMFLLYGVKCLKTVADVVYVNVCYCKLFAAAILWYCCNDRKYCYGQVTLFSLQLS